MGKLDYYGCSKNVLSIFQLIYRCKQTGQPGKKILHKINWTKFSRIKVYLLIFTICIVIVNLASQTGNVFFFGGLRNFTQNWGQT